VRGYADHLLFRLRYGHQDPRLQSFGEIGIAGVDALARADQHRPVQGQLRHELRQVGQRPSEPIQLVNHDALDLSSVDFFVLRARQPTSLNSEHVRLPGFDPSEKSERIFRRSMAMGEMTTTTGGPCGRDRDLVSSDLMALKKAAAAASVASLEPPLGGWSILFSSSINWAASLRSWSCR
jgi:hypothetical protein